MIQVMLKDGQPRSLETAKVSISWEGELDEEGNQIEHGLDDVRALMFLDPVLGVMPGVFKGMPIMGMRYSDEANDLAIEIPLPLDYAEAFGKQLGKETLKYVNRIRADGRLPSKGIERYASIPEDLKGTQPGNGAS